MIIVSNATPLISLAKIDRLYLLQDMFEKIYIPQGVYEEVVMEGAGKDGAEEVSAAQWIQVIDVHDRPGIKAMSDKLDKGESETIVLAQELGANLVLMDERLARRKLEALGVRKIGTLGILLKAKDTGLIVAIRPDMDHLIARGIRIGRRVYRQVLQIADEL